MKKIRNIILIAIILMAVTINTSCYAKIENEIKVDTSTQVSASHGGGGRSRATNTTNTTASDLIINPDNYKPTEVKGEDLGTGKSQEITITASSNLSKEEIDRAVYEARMYEEEDQKRREAAGQKKRPWRKKKE